jgi:cyclohexyl-isocyanide hydratase
MIMVPGGPGQQDLMEDEVVLEFLRRQARSAKYITSVCTGSLVLGAAGLLKGRRATSHWAAIEHLKALGAIPVAEKVVTDGNVITGAGVTSGIDFALKVAADAGAHGGGRIQRCELDALHVWDRWSLSRDKIMSVATSSPGWR